MHVSQPQTYCVLVLASVAIATLLTFGDRLLPTPVGPAVAESQQDVAISACEGMAWPNYDAVCMEQISGTKPDRILGLASAD
jgi:hypothetical protein